MSEPDALPDLSDLKIIEVVGDHRGCYEVFSTPDNSLGLRVWYYNFLKYPTAAHHQPVNQRPNIFDIDRIFILLWYVGTFKHMRTPWVKRDWERRAVFELFKAFNFGGNECFKAFGINESSDAVILRSHVFLATPRGELFSIPTYRLKQLQKGDSYSCIPTRNTRFAFDNVEGNGSCFKLYIDEVPSSRTLTFSGFMNGTVLSRLLGNLNELAKRAALAAQKA